MSNLLVLSEVDVKGNKIERIGSRYASKLRLTEATYLSLLKIIHQKKLDKSVEKWNEKYRELYNAVAIKETEAAEQEVRDKLSAQNSKAEEEKREAQRIIEEDNAVAKIIKYEVVKPKLSALKIKINKLQNRFGKIKGKFGVNVKKGNYSPKGLSVPINFERIFREIFDNSDMYKMDMSSEKVKEEAEVKKETATPSSSWRTLFDGVVSKQEDFMIALDKTGDDEEITNESVEVEKNISQNELERRKSLADLDDQLTNIEDLIKTTDGLASPFYKGLEERKTRLLKILSDVTGIDSIALYRKENTTSISAGENTDFQNLIRDIVGDKKQLTPEEHKAVEEEMNEYYQEAGEHVDRLLGNDTLNHYNQPEVLQKIKKAENIANDREAEKAKNVEIIDNSEVDDKEDNIDNTIVTIEALNQAVAIEDERKKELGIAKESKKTISDGEEQAEIVFDNNLLEEGIKAAPEQAGLILDEELFEAALNETNDHEQMMRTLKNYISENEKFEREKKQETKPKAVQPNQEWEIAVKDQAERILDRDLLEKGLADAPSLAVNIYYNNQKAELIEAAHTLARNIFDDSIQNTVQENNQQEAEKQRDIVVKQIVQSNLKNDTATKENTRNYTMTNMSSRYATFVSQPKPIKLRATQKANIDKRNKKNAERGLRAIKTNLINEFEHLKNSGDEIRSLARAA